MSNSTVNRHLALKTCLQLQAIIELKKIQPPAGPPGYKLQLTKFLKHGTLGAVSWQPVMVKAAPRASAPAGPTQQTCCAARDGDPVDCSVLDATSYKPE